MELKDFSLRMKHVILGNYLDLLDKHQSLAWAAINFLYQHSELLSQVVFVTECQIFETGLIISASDNQVMFLQENRVYTNYEAALCSFCAQAMEEQVRVCLRFPGQIPQWYVEFATDSAEASSHRSKDYQEVYLQAHKILIDEALDVGDKARFMLLTANLQRLKGFPGKNIE